MKYLFTVSHPAHFHMFKNVIKNLQHNGHQVVVVLRPKDVLEKLCIDYGLTFHKVSARSENRGVVNLAHSIIKRTSDVVALVRKEKPCMLIGSDGTLAYVGSLCHIPSFEVFDDDVSVIKLYANLFFPFYTNLICPSITDAGRWKNKKIGYAGYQKLTYLHPNYFKPSIEVCRKYINIEQEPFFLIRTVNLTAHHDGGIKGLSNDTIDNIIEMLKPHGKVYMSSEKPLPSKYEQYRLKINPLDIHHVMSYAILYIGDSQSMAVEAAMLGTPSIRFNDFAGKIGVLEELQNKYKLTFGIPSSEPQQLYDKIEELLAMPNLREEFQTRRQRMLADKIDVTAFFTWFIENYPESKRIMKENPDYQYNFK